MQRILSFKFLFLFQYTHRDYAVLVEVLEPMISVKAKEEIASCLVNIMQKLGQAKEFLTDIVMAEMDRLGNIKRKVIFPNNKQIQKRLLRIFGGISDW